MSNMDRIAQLEHEISEIKKTLTEKENELRCLKNEPKEKLQNPYCPALNAEEVVRYSRQIIMSEIKIGGQLKLKQSKVLIVGAGGLGCPAALYLAAAGVGNITLIDNDCVELSNLHRQILHNEDTVGVEKVKSAKDALKRLNKNIQVQAIQTHLTSANVFEVMKDFDVVIDGTDNVATRYLLNDACVLNNKPLVSGSALQMEGQLTVYHYENGPCYRCLFPTPPPPETVTSCGDGGVLGAVPGCIGVLQALETIKILLNIPDILSGRMLVFDGSNTTFRNITLRKRNPNCAVCGDNPTVTKPIDYEQFCQANTHDKGDNINILSKDDRIPVREYKKSIMDTKHLLIDVRSVAEFEMCRLPHSLNIPFTNIQKNLHSEELKKIFSSENINSNDTVFLVCRRGNDSQRAVKILQEEFPYKFKDIIGGLHAYSDKIDKRFPVY